MMKPPMGPPPARNPNPNPDPKTSTGAAQAAIEEAAPVIPPDGDASDGSAALVAAKPENEAPEDPDPNPSSTPSGSKQRTAPLVPYSIPPWSEPPGHPFFFEVLKNGAIIDKLDVSEKGAYMFGRIDLCDFMLEHPTISRFHAVLQFKKDAEASLFDLGSTHGTFINKIQVKEKVYTKVHVGDVIRFGQSSRLYIFQGPSEFMPPEGDLKKLRDAKLIREEMIDREASLSRARDEASLADGISWGMGEDAIVDTTENDADEITWQTYKGQLTERQEKTHGKVIKRMEKVANMKKEIDAIRAKDITQGGLTQGQQTQIARNEQRISQILEELESLEETLNESIQESIGARAGKVVHGRKKGNVEEEDDFLSDDDDFYDRTKKSSAKKSIVQKSVETADTLLDKKEAISRELEEKRALLMNQKDKVPAVGSHIEGGDDLDSYMTGLSSQMAHEKVVHIQKELSDLQAEFDRVMYLLKIADPMGEAVRKREAKAQAIKFNEPIPSIPKQWQSEVKKNLCGKPDINSQLEKTFASTQVEKTAVPVEGKEVCEKENEMPAYVVTKPQWLGATKDMESEQDHMKETNEDVTGTDEFIDYKDRKKAFASLDDGHEIEQEAAGLFIRKRKPVDKPGETSQKMPKVAVSPEAEAEATAADAVALLLKHKRGYYGLDEEMRADSQQLQTEGQSFKDKSQSRRVFGPSKQDFIDKGPDYESWVPPEGQTGDGRTSLNDRLGY